MKKCIFLLSLAFFMSTATNYPFFDTMQASWDYLKTAKETLSKNFQHYAPNIITGVGVGLAGITAAAIYARLNRPLIGTLLMTKNNQAYLAKNYCNPKKEIIAHLKTLLDAKTMQTFDIRLEIFGRDKEKIDALAQNILQGHGAYVTKKTFPPLNNRYTNTYLGRTIFTIKYKK